jgi:hypothetical protein
VAGQGLLGSRSVSQATGKGLNDLPRFSYVPTNSAVATTCPSIAEGATVDLIVRMSGKVIDKGTPGTTIVGLRVSMAKKVGRWLVTDAEFQEPVRASAVGAVAAAEAPTARRAFPAFAVVAFVFRGESGEGGVFVDTLRVRCCFRERHAF